MFTVASLFTGCGGGDLGLHGDFTFLNNTYEKLPYKLVYANEIDPKIADIFNANFNIKCDIRDIRNVLDFEIPNHDILVGGFPCQSFSIVAQNPKRLGYKNDNGQLFFEMCRILKLKKPMAFIAENVKGIQSANGGEAFPLIIGEFQNCGYKVETRVLNAADFGVPQKRQRVFIIGIRDDIDCVNGITFPDATYFETENHFRKSYVPLGRVVFPEYNIDEKYYFSDKAVQGMLNAKKEMNKGRAQDFTKPCNTVGAHLAKVSINSTDPVLKVNGRFRRFIPREVACIQSFPDSFILTGSDATQYRALGNAIPPVLMWHVAKNLAETLSTSYKFKFAI